MIALLIAVQAATGGATGPASTSSPTQTTPPPVAIGAPDKSTMSPDLKPTTVTTNVSSYPASFFTAAQPNTAYDMISRLPGFTFDDGGSVRGYGGAAGNVIINGQRPASKNDDLISVLTRIPAGQVERIDIIRGGAPGIDMQGKAVIANVIRHAGAKTSLSATLTGQVLTQDGRIFPTLRVEGSHDSADGRSWSASFNGSRQFDDGVGDGVRETRDKSGRIVAVATDHAKGDEPDFIATGSYAQPLWGGQLRINGSGEYLRYTGTEQVTTAAVPADDSDERDVQHAKLGEIGVNYTKKIAAGLSSETVLLQQVTAEDYLASIRTGPITAAIDEQLFRERHVKSESIARETLTWISTPRLTIEGGAEGDYNYLASHTGLVDQGIVQAVPAANVTIDEARGELFAKGTWVPSHKLQVELGFRMEGSRIGSSGDVTLSKTLLYPKPRALFTWSPNDHDQLRLRLEREVGQLDFASFVASSSFSTGQVRVGNPDLVPQQADVVEGVYERHFLKDGAAVVTLRHSELTDVVDRAPVFTATGDFDAPANIGSGREDELLVDTTLPLAKLGLKGGLLKANAAWRDSSVIDPTIGDHRAIAGLRPFEAKLTFTQDLPRQHLSLSAIVNRGWTQTFFYFNQIERDRVLPYGTIQADYKPTKGWSMLFEVYEIGTGVDRRITSWNDTRRSGAPDATQDRNLKLGPALLFRIRRDV